MSNSLRKIAAIAFSYIALSLLTGCPSTTNLREDSGGAGSSLDIYDGISAYATLCPDALASPHYKGERSGIVNSFMIQGKPQEWRKFNAATRIDESRAQEIYMQNRRDLLEQLNKNGPFDSTRVIKETHLVWARIDRPRKRIELSDSEITITRSLDRFFAKPFSSLQESWIDVSKHLRNSGARAGFISDIQYSPQVRVQSPRPNTGMEFSLKADMSPMLTGFAGASYGIRVDEEILAEMTDAFIERGSTPSVFVEIEYRLEECRTVSDDSPPVAIQRLRIYETIPGFSRRQGRLLFSWDGA